DGFDDVIVGANRAGTSADGRAYVIFGSDFSAVTTALGNSGDNTLEADQGSEKDVLVGEEGDDNLACDDGPDVLLGGSGNDWLVVVNDEFLRVDGGGGIDTLAVGTADLELDLGDIPLVRLQSIEAI